jgi:hypothetical protein
MARFTLSVLAGGNVYHDYKMAATTTDADIDKPVKLSAADTVELCADGDPIHGFIAAVAGATSDGVKLCSIMVNGRQWVILDGNAAVGSLIEAAANTASGTAKAGDWGIVSAHVVDDTSAATVVATSFRKNWQVISGAGTDTTVALIETV